ncbi:MAG: hypothetical protein ACOVO2_14625 [Emticicia sp.]|uniref:hypothetical protein n=1 Tax=Emticicia sp. TaxID=1930953 RepID=UPI003BA687C1
MKTKSNYFRITLIILISHCMAYAQNFQSYDETFFYEFKIPVKVTNAENAADVKYAPSQSTFTLLSKDVTGYKILFWKWQNDDMGYQTSFNYKDSSLPQMKIEKIDNKKIFIVSEDDFKNYAIPVYKRNRDWSAGLVVLPLKYRGSPKTFSKDFSLGLSGGFKWRLSKYNPTYLHFLVNCGISAVTVDSLSSKGKIKQPSDLAAATFAIGTVLENHSFQFGIFGGFDRLTAADYVKTNWIYNRKPWLSIGIGYQIFSKDSKSKNNSAGSNNN